MVTSKLFLRVLLVASWGAVVGPLAGCGDSDWGYVEGMVTLEGQPVGPGTLIFEPADPTRKNDPSATGHLNHQGEYVLTSVGGKQGAPVGKYRVTIQGGDSTALAEEAIGGEILAAKIPPRYQSPSAGLTADVVPGRQEIDFNLEKTQRRKRR